MTRACDVVFRERSTVRELASLRRNVQETLNSALAGSARSPASLPRLPCDDVFRWFSEQYRDLAQDIVLATRAAMDSSSRSLRRNALQKIATLSATTSSSTTFDNSDLDRLCKTSGFKSESYGSNTKPNGLSSQPMNVREFEVLLSLCKAAPYVKTYESAARLTYQLSPYVLESPSQAFAWSPYYRDIQPSPLEHLSYNLTSAILSVGINHEQLKESIIKKLWVYLDHCSRSAQVLSPRNEDGWNASASSELEDSIKIAQITLSFLGFLDAAATFANFWSAGERLLVIEKVRYILSESFLVSVETAFSTLRNAHSADRIVLEWKRYIRHYAAAGRPLGAMLLQRSFMWLLVASSSLLVAHIDDLAGNDILEIMMREVPIFRPATAGSTDSKSTMIETLAEIAAYEISLIEDGADYMRIGSAWQQKLAFSVKAGALISYSICAILDDDAADPDILMAWLKQTLLDPVQMADETLASVVLRCLALCATISPDLAPDTTRALPRYIVQGGAREKIADIAARSLAHTVKLLSTDAVISTLYSLGNVVSSSNGTERALAVEGDLLGRNSTTAMYQHRNSAGSAISFTVSDEDNASATYNNVIRAICIVASNSQDEKIIALAQSMLLQKISKVNKAVDIRIIVEAASLALNGGTAEFKSLLKVFDRITEHGISQNDNAILEALITARNHLSANVSRESALFAIYLEHILESIISNGDVHQEHNTRESDVDIAARQIAQLLQPLAILMQTHNFADDTSIDDEIISMIRDVWFNLVVHGFDASTVRRGQYANELRTIAAHSQPLVSESRGEQQESDIELNTILRRGMSSDHEARQKKTLSGLLPQKANEIRSLSYRKVIFLQAAYLLETLRASSGDCTKALTYFLEPSMRTGEMSSSMTAISQAVIDEYLRNVLAGTNPSFSAPYVAKQLALIFCGCCHRIERVQQSAIACAEHIIRSVPSALCHQSSVFALLELLTLMWSSCLEAETDEYQWRSSFTSTRGKVTIQLSDDFTMRKQTLNTLYKKAKIWMIEVINIAPLDVKNVLQTYLSDYDDDGAYGHISLGRSFASEMGGMVPSTDQKLAALDRHGDFGINAASDFIAQYTTRQEYRYAEITAGHDIDWPSSAKSPRARRGSATAQRGAENEDVFTALAHLEARTLQRKFAPISEVRSVLRRAAALLCCARKDECAIVQYLVGIPFAMFTKQSINLGISLWLGVIAENFRMESLILVEIAQQFRMSIYKKQGIFNDEFLHPDPFYIKEEFAPSDRATLNRRQQIAHNLLAPHSRLIAFFASHFNATRLSTPEIQRIFISILKATLRALSRSTGHPLSREIRHHIILFGLKVLKFSTTLTPAAKLRLKDQILTAALQWFAFAPSWSFGSNRLGVKAEVRLLVAVEQDLGSVSITTSNTNEAGKFLQVTKEKEELLRLLLQSEQARLAVWLNPLGDRDAQNGSRALNKSANDTTLSRLMKVAWTINPSLAIHLVTRFNSPSVRESVRGLLLQQPQRAIAEPEALHILLGDTLSNDIQSQLKYLLYWAPVNPITAITYFLPAYSSHPYILQYAMRALEHHPVDVTFFYVPQIVQTLRYDALGYVERYIVETAQFSQLFAHQIIWNMKANHFKDGDADAAIPDVIKPTLDRVTTRMIASFSGNDKEFFEKEFAFFDEVTDISGKLKPFIKKSKPEKKQKIEEELRKIKVEIGVYLPSNPDGVVVGIDRKSGKPLQSHAKAPYMATFRIRKNLTSMEETDDMLQEANAVGVVPKENTIEIWQSAIFKVGDDCRQDVLALQMIAAFRGIFNCVGLDVYVFPYRVTATAPGCGVIDVLPNSVSRDMLGREAVNGLYEYFVSKYGNEDSIRFQEARNNFVKSMAAYSLISYILQFKDRHNGNIMLDDAGHILHIDFGFCFDIAPGGVKFERAPFKLTTEMVSVMGGSAEHQSFRWFEELTIKSFLASRQYCEKLSQIVLLMMDSGLPCFKPESMANFRDRFVLHMSEREAAEYMKGLIRRAYSSYSTTVYDEFQRLTNSIPY